MQKRQHGAIWTWCRRSACAQRVMQKGQLPSRAHFPLRGSRPAPVRLAWLGIRREICGRAPIPFGSLVASGGGRLRPTLRRGPCDNEKRGGKSMLPKWQG